MIVFFDLLFILLLLYIITLFYKHFFSLESKNQSIIKNSNISRQQWDEAFSQLPLLNGLDEKEKKALEELSILFMHDKSFKGAQDLELTPHMQLII